MNPAIIAFATLLFVLLASTGVLAIPQASIVQINGISDSGPFGVFSYFADGNLTIALNVLDLDSNSLLLDLNYSSSPTVGTGTSFVQDLNLATLGTTGPFSCQDTNFQDTTICSADWNIWGVPDANYYIVLSLFNGTDPDPATDVSGQSFRVSNRRAPSVSVTQIEGNPDNGSLPFFSYFRDGNLTIDFNVQNPDSNNLMASVAYSSSRVQGSGTTFITDLNLSALGTSGPFNCADTDFSDSTRCSVDWNISSVPDTNYYVLVTVQDGSLSAFDASEKSFLIDNTDPSVTWDGNNNTWQKTDANIHLTCSDGSGSSCAAIYYRLDTNSGTGVSYGSWTTFGSSILISSDGNWALDFNAVDRIGNSGPVTTRYILIDKTAPTVTISSPAAGATVSSSSVTLGYQGSDPVSGIRKYLVWVDNGNRTNNSLGLMYTFTGQADGQHTYHVQATDNADNNSPDTNVTITVSAGNNPPPDQNQTCSQKLGIICNANETCSGSWLSVRDSNSCCSMECIPPVIDQNISLISFSTEFNRNRVKQLVPLWQELESRLDFSGKRLAFENELLVTRTLVVLEIRHAGQLTGYLNRVRIELQNISDQNLGRLQIVEKIPKEWIASASEVKTDANLSVWVEDPVISFSIAALDSNMARVLSYFFETDLNSGPISRESFDSWGTPIVMVSLDSNDSCQNVSCAPSDPCQLPYCQAGACKAIARQEGIECGEGKTCQAGICTTTNPEPPSPPGLAIGPEILVGIAAIVLVGSILVLFLSKRKKRPPKKPSSVPGSPENEKVKRELKKALEKEGIIPASNEKTVSSIPPVPKQSAFSLDEPPSTGNEDLDRRVRTLIQQEEQFKTEKKEPEPFSFAPKPEPVAPVQPTPPAPSPAPVSRLEPPTISTIDPISKKIETPFGSSFQRTTGFGLQSPVISDLDAFSKQPIQPVPKPFAKPVPPVPSPVIKPIPPKVFASPPKPPLAKPVPAPSPVPKPAPKPAKPEKPKKEKILPSDDLGF